MASTNYTSHGTPLSPTSIENEKRPYQYEVVPEDKRLSKASAADQRMKHKIRRLRVIQRVLNLIVSIIVLGIMVNTYVSFVNNRSIQSGGQTILIYPANPITWPTYMMIATGAVSILFNSAIMIAYIRGVAASNRVSMYSSYLGYLMHIVNIGVWLATSTTFQKSQGPADAVPPPNDLYGWTCSNKVDQLASQYTLPVNFNLLCQSQQVSFAMGIIQVGLELLAIAINFYALRRLIHKKRTELLELRASNSEPTVR